MNSKEGDAPPHLKIGNISVILVNSPKSEEFVINNRSQRLNVKSYWPPEGQILKGVIIGLHGYASHIGRPTHRYLGESFNQEGYGYVTLDFHAHGHSEGIERGFVESPNDLVDDVLSLLFHLFSSHVCNLKKVDIQLPFYLLGHSMGGGTALLVSQIISECKLSEFSTPFALVNMDRIAYLQKFFNGCMLFCPVVQLTRMTAVHTFLVAPLSKLFPSYSFPKWLFDESESNHHNWANHDYIRYIESDGYPHNANGLSYGSNICFATLNSLFELANHTQKIMTSSKFPFIVFHDPEEKCLSFEGSLMFYNNSQSQNKTLVRVENGLHDIIANKLDFASHECLCWLDKQNYKVL